MNGKKTVLLALMAVCGLVLFSPRAWAWQRTISDGGANGVAVDAAGDVVVGGSVCIGLFCHFAVLKFSGADGTELWRQIIISSMLQGGSASRVAVDAAGNVVAAGYTVGRPRGNHFTVIKFSGVDGRELWRQVIAPDCYRCDDSAQTLAVDAAGDVVAGGITGYAPSSSFFGGAFTVVKFSGANGTELWRREISGSTGAPPYNVARAVKVDAAGDVVAAGITRGMSDFFVHFTVIKFSGVDGRELWRQAIDGNNWLNEALAVAIDASGDAVAAGGLDVIHHDFTVIKFSGADGTELWRQIEYRDSYGSANTVAVDATGDVVAAGRVGPGASLLAVKLSGSDGTELWADMPENADRASAVTVDAAGDVVIAGSTFAVIKFSGVDGTELWRQVISPGGANDVAVDAAGDVVAAGSLVVKLRGTDGSDF